MFLLILASRILSRSFRVTGTNLPRVAKLDIVQGRITSIFIFLLRMFKKNRKRWSVDPCLLVALLPPHQWTAGHKDLGHPPELLIHLFTLLSDFSVYCLHAVKGGLDLITLDAQLKRPKVKLSPKLIR